MKSFFVTLITAMSLIVFSACSSKDSKDENAANEQAGESDSLVFEDQSEGDFFGTEGDVAFDDDMPAEALGEVAPLESEPMPNFEGNNDDAFASVDPGAPAEESDPFLAENADPFAAPADAADPAIMDDPFAAAVDGGDTLADPFAEAADPFATDVATSEEVVPSETPGALGDGFFESTEPTTTTAAVVDDIENDENEISTLVPVKKIKDLPVRRAGQLLNAVYIVRPDDTIQNVSQKIYGSDRTGDLMAANPHLNRSFKTGDKVYYNSPVRPNDENQMKTFYEDQNVRSETYVSQEGDNIRKVSSDLLGFDGAWKEVWATNPDVESKWLLTSGVRLKYWKGNGATAPMNELASNGFQEPALAEPQAAVMEEPTTPPVAQEPVEEFADMAANEMPSDFEQLPEEPMMPPAQDMAANMPPSDFQEPPMEDFESLPPAEPSDFNNPPTDDFASNQLPPPPPPPPMNPPVMDDEMGGNKELANVQEAGSDDPMAAITNMDDDMMMLMAALGVFVLGGGVLVMIKKKKARQAELEDALNDHTQVG